MTENNLFRKILNELPHPKIEIIPDDPKDKDCASQMSSMINWKIVESKSDSHPKFGYPMGKVLCRNLEEAQDHINNSEFNDCFIIDYI